MTTQYTPPAVPLDVCLRNIYDAQGQTQLEVDVVVKILEGVVNSGNDRRSLNATKVLPRIAGNTLQLWYILRHAGFEKQDDRLVCPSTFPVDQTNAVLDKLKKIIVEQQAKRNNNNNSSGSSNNAPTSPVASAANVAQSPNNNNSMNDLELSTTTSPQSSSSLQSPTSPSQNNTSGNSIPNVENTGSNQSTGQKKALKDMTAEERRAYVAEQMRNKKKQTQ